MTAKEMFEELGYEHSEGQVVNSWDGQHSPFGINYNKDSHCIVFVYNIILTDKIEYHKEFSHYHIAKKYGKENYNHIFTKEEHQAINQQMKELE